MLEGTVEEVPGEGVVGEQPRLTPTQAFKYTSYCPLKTRWGTMEGTYHFERERHGSIFECEDRAVSTWR